jgi:hypothetical protein
MFLKKLIKPIVEVCKKNCSCVCDEMIYRIAKEQGITIVSLSMKQKNEIEQQPISDVKGGVLPKKDRCD